MATMRRIDPDDRADDDRTTKITVTIPRNLLAEVRALSDANASETPNVSALVTEALRHHVSKLRLVALLHELDHESGPVPPEIQADVDAEWRPIFADMNRRQARADSR